MFSQRSLVVLLAAMGLIGIVYAVPMPTKPQLPKPAANVSRSLCSNCAHQLTGSYGCTKKYCSRTPEIYQGLVKTMMNANPVLHAKIAAEHMLVHRASHAAYDRCKKKNIVYEDTAIKDIGATLIICFQLISDHADFSGSILLSNETDFQFAYEEWQAHGRGKEKDLLLLSKFTCKP